MSGNCTPRKLAIASPSMVCSDASPASGMPFKRCCAASKAARAVGRLPSILSLDSARRSRYSTSASWKACASPPLAAMVLTVSNSALRPAIASCKSLIFLSIAAIWVCCLASCWAKSFFCCSVLALCVSWLSRNKRVSLLATSVSPFCNSIAFFSGCTSPANPSNCSLRF